MQAQVQNASHSKSLCQPQQKWDTPFDWLLWLIACHSSLIRLQIQWSNSRTKLSHLQFFFCRPVQYNTLQHSNYLITFYPTPLIQHSYNNKHQYERRRQRQRGEKMRHARVVGLYCRHYLWDGMFHLQQKHDATARRRHDGRSWTIFQTSLSDIWYVWCLFLHA